VAIDTVAELLTAIAALPASEQAAARARVVAALEAPAPAARAALGLLALDLAAAPTAQPTAGPDADGAFLVLPELDRLGA
jgi:hypothetical protein